MFGITLFQKRCDRCNKTLDKSRYLFCMDCKNIDPVTLRSSELSLQFKSQHACSNCSSADRLLEEVCYNCATQHPDNTHTGFYSLGSKPKDDETQERQDHCFMCGAVRIALRNATQLRYVYYKLGDSKPTRTPFSCSNTSLEVTHKIQERCTHKWLILRDKTANNSAVANSIKNNHLVRDLYAISDFDLHYMAHGYRVNWCVKCGSFNKYSPQLTKLPIKGL